MLREKRINIFCGHYGSGKTNIAVNYAMALKSAGNRVCIADLDIVNPYFRTKDSEEELSASGIRLVAPKYASSNVDLPSLPSEVYSIFSDKEEKAVIDVGGDDRGALALGRFVPAIVEEGNYDMFYVVNFSRPLTTTAADALEVMYETSSACGLGYTGIVNNTNLGDETDIALVESSIKEAKLLSELSGVPLAFTCAREDICPEGFFPLKLQKKYY